MRKDILREIKYVRHVSSRVISLLARIPSPCALKVNFQIFGRGMRCGFDELALIERHLKRLCINMIHAVASYLCRDIEVVITGLTRNQFVSNHTRVRIPLSAPNIKSIRQDGFFRLAENTNRDSNAENKTT